MILRVPRFISVGGTRAQVCGNAITIIRSDYSALKKAVARAGICKPVSVQTLRQSFATYLLHSGTDVCTVQELLGHLDPSTAVIYPHVLKVAAAGTASPLDFFALHLQPG